MIISIFSIWYISAVVNVDAIWYALLMPVIAINIFLLGILFAHELGRDVGYGWLLNILGS
jgi:putative exporter of polyketide antibiotics